MGRHVADGALRTLAELEINRRDILKAQILGSIGFRAYRVYKDRHGNKAWSSRSWDFATIPCNRSDVRSKADIYGLMNLRPP